MPVVTNVEIVDYASGYGGDAFARLNVEWLEEYFRVEPIDHEVLSDPQGKVIDCGGVILYALVEGVAVGTVALKRDSSGDYELTKMVVTEGHQGRGLGRQLLSAVVARFGEIGGRRL